MYGNGAVLGYEYRMHDTRIGRFWSVDPLSAKFPWNSPYAFAENSPVGFIEMEGLEKLIAISMGEDVKYRPLFLQSHNQEVETYNIKNSVNAMGVLTDILIKSTAEDENGIGFLAIFSHGTENNIFAIGNFGNGISSNDLNVLSPLIEDNSVRFYNGSIIYLGGCNTGKMGDIINDAGETEYAVFAQKFADITGASVIAADDRITPVTEKKDGSMMKYSTAYPQQNSFMLFQKDKAPVPLGGVVDVIDYLKQIETLKQTPNNIEVDENGPTK